MAGRETVYKYGFYSYVNPPEKTSRDRNYLMSLALSVCSQEAARKL